MNKSYLINTLHELMDIISGENLQFAAGSKILSELIDSVTNPAFPVSVFGDEQRSRLLAQIYSSDKDTKDSWDQLGVQISDLEMKNVSRILTSKVFLFVADAVHIFSQKERAILSALLGDRLAYQVVIAVNNMNYVEEPDEVKEWVGNALRPYFLNETGAFDDKMYDQHVCFVDSQDAASIQYLKNQLSDIFRDDKKRLLAESAAATQVVLYVVNAAREYINRIILSDNQALDAAAKVRKHADDQQRQQQLQAQKQQDLQDRIKFKVYRSLVQYIDKMDAEWESNASGILDATDVDLKELLNAFISEKQMQVLQIKINKHVQNYLRLEFQKWSRQLAVELETDFSELRKLQIEIDALETRELTNVFASSRYQTLEGAALQKLIQNMSQRILLGGRSLDRTLLKLLVRATLLYMLFFARMPMLQLSSLVAFLGSETIGARQEIEEFRKDFLNELQRKLLGNLRNAVTKPELTFISSYNTDKFMTLVSERKLPITDRVFTTLSPTVQQNLKKFYYLDSERAKFVAELNAAIGKWDRCNPDEIDDSISSETQNTILTDPDTSRGYRLLLAETFPDHIYQNLQDILYSHIDYQIFQQIFKQKTASKESQETMNEYSLDMISTSNEKELLGKHDMLYRASAKLQECFASLVVSVYGIPYSSDEMEKSYARKSPFFGNLSDE